MSFRASDKKRQEEPRAFSFSHTGIFSQQCFLFGRTPVVMPVGWLAAPYLDRYALKFDRDYSAPCTLMISVNV